MPAERRFDAMGTSAHIVVCGGPAELLDRAVGRVAELESRWSRFRRTSEVTRLNDAPHGRPTIVSRDTFRLVDAAVSAWRETNGYYDPTVLTAMIANGYGKTFDSIRSDVRSRPAPAGPTPGCAGIELDAATHSIVLPVGVGFDPGGIGKGLAADIVVTELIKSGARGALVDLGGDVRVAGVGPNDGSWIIDIEDPHDPERNLLHLMLSDAGIATSSRLRRRWQRNGIEHHHLIDPRTGDPIVSPLVAVSVIASQAWRAEALTKAVFVAGDLSPVSAASAITVDERGGTFATPDLEDMVR